MPTHVDFTQEGLLEGTEGAAREQREALLRELHDDGVPLDELRAAVAEERLVLLPVERLLGGEPKYTREELAERVGVDAEVLRTTRRAFGLPGPGPDERVLSDEDRVLAEALAKLLAAGLPAERILDLNRVMGRSMSQLAAALRTAVGEEFVQAGDTERDVAQRLVAFTEASLPLLAPALERVFALHLRELLRSDLLGVAQLTSGGPADRPVTVAFADLVGFTKLGGELPADQLGRVASRLETLAGDAMRSPVRLVKTIGDAVMLVSVDPVPLLEVLLELVDAAEREGESFPLLRAGVACGPAIERDGDLYGAPVNLASRLTDVARPSSVLASESVREQVGDGPVRWSFAGKRKLKGVGEVSQFRARRAEPASD